MGATVAIFFHSRPVFRVFTSTKKILYGAAFASAGLAALYANLGPSLIQGNHTDARFLATFSMFTFSTAIFISFFPVPIPVISISGILRGTASTAHQSVVIQFYNTMLQMNNIRFNYVERNENFINGDTPSPERHGVGRLLSKNERSRHLDEEQQQQISKKKTLYQGSSLNYSQIYSDIRINRNEKIQPRHQNLHEQIKYINHSSNMIVTNKYQSLNQSNGLVDSRNLPKIAKNPRTLSSSTPKQMDANLNPNHLAGQNDNTTQFSRAKAFSISHYDIYKPGFLVNRKSAMSAKKESITEQPIEELNKQQNNSVVRSQLQGELENEMPQQPLKINFQNSSDKDLVQNEVSQLQSSKNLSKQARSSSKLSVLKAKGEALKKIEDQPIQVQYLNKNIKKQRESVIKLEKSTRQERVEENQKVVKAQKVHKIQAKQRQSKQATPAKESSLKNSNKSIYQPLKVSESKEVKNQQNDTEVLFHPIKSTKKLPPQGLEIDHNTKSVNAANQLQKSSPREAFSVKQVPQKQQPKDETQEIARQATNRDQNIQNQQQLTKQKTGIKEQSYRPYQYFKFNIQDYMKIYEILKNIHSFLKNPVLDSHNLIKQIKRYLQTVASGSLDHIQGYDMPLHRLKIVKNALLFERIAIVIVSFAYCVGKLKESLKFIINLVTYAINNTLIILKILESSDLTKQVAKNPIMAKSDRLVIKKNYDTVRNNNDIILDSIFKISKYQQVFSQSFKDILKSVGKSSLQQTFYNVLEYFAFFLCVSDLHMALPFLAVAPNPYLRQTLDKRPTLIIDIVQIFCHGTRKSKSHVFRPHTEHFLNEMSQYYEIVSFTCAYPNQIDKVIDILDTKKHIKHRLYRHHAVWKNSILYKETERIGRDLDRLLLLDSATNTIKGQSNNTIMIPVWRGNKNDTTLAQLCPILAAIAIKNLNCQEATKKIHQQQLKNENAGIKYLNFGINLE